MRIGERLVRAGTITRDQLREALAHQVLYGGRLGTNLVEHFFIDLDPLADALAEQHRVPAAHKQHFDTADTWLQARLEPELAASFRAIPLRVDGSSGRALVATTDPTDTEAAAELSEALGREVELAVAPELRVFYYLELVYGVPRPNRMLRVRTDEAPPGEAEYEAMELEWEEAERTPTPAPRRDRRRYVTTLSDVEPPEPPTQLARIAIKRVPIAPDGSVEPTDLEARIRAIRQATGRDRIGDLVVGALSQDFDDLDAGVLLVIRQEVAIGWKGFVRDGAENAVEAVAVPLGGPSILRPCYLDATTYIGSPAEVATDMDRRLWDLLRTEDPADVTVVPIAPGGHVVCLLYAHVLPPKTLDAHTLRGIRTLAQTTTNAFERLIRAAQR